VRREGAQGQLNFQIPGNGSIFFVALEVGLSSALAAASLRRLKVAPRVSWGEKIFTA
jgi:hypothetical protein